MDILNMSELFVANQHAFAKNFTWESDDMYALCSSMVTAKGLEVDVDKLNECKRILKRKTGVFSDFQGHIRLPLLTAMMLSENPEAKLDHVMKVFQLLKGKKIFYSEGLLVCALAICNSEHNMDDELVVQKTWTLYEKMTKNHPFLTSDKDTTFAAVLAMAGMDTDEVVNEMEACYHILDGKFFSADAVQSLSHVLALQIGNSQEKCQKVMDLYHALKAKNKKYGTSYELAVLGCLALLDVDSDRIIDEIKAADDYIKKQKGFGSFSMDSYHRIMYAAILVMNQYTPDSKVLSESAISGAISTVIAQVVAEQVALMTVMTCTVVAATAN